MHFHSRRLGAFVLARLAVLLALMSLPGLAASQPTSVTLVSNMSQSISFFPAYVAQSFTTGASSLGYMLDGIGVALHIVDGSQDAASTVRLRTDNSGAPGSVLAMLNAPSEYINGMNTFAASAAIPLAPSTTYWITLGEGVSPVASLHPPYLTRLDTETGLGGWTIGDSLLHAQAAPASWANTAALGTNNSSLQVSVTGYAVPAVHAESAAVDAETLTHRVRYRPGHRGSGGAQ